MFVFYQSIKDIIIKTGIFASKVEDLLQTRYNHLPLGVKLWRAPAKGSNHSLEEEEEFKVFMTFSFDLPLGHTIVVQY